MSLPLTALLLLGCGERVETAEKNALNDCINPLHEVE